jgi:hypothetical protein
MTGISGQESVIRKMMIPAADGGINESFDASGRSTTDQRSPLDYCLLMTDS